MTTKSFVAIVPLLSLTLTRISYLVAAPGVIFMVLVVLYAQALVYSVEVDFL